MVDYERAFIAIVIGYSLLLTFGACYLWWKQRRNLSSKTLVYIIGLAMISVLYILSPGVILFVLLMLREPRNILLLVFDGSLILFCLALIIYFFRDIQSIYKKEA